MDSFFAPSSSLLLETYNAFEKETPTIFTVEVPRSFICAICCEILKEAVFLKCGHSFCNLCIKRSLRTKLECPLDRFFKTKKNEFNLKNKEIF
jgi:E3 ubiquitin-protein ligase RFWD2